MKLQDINEHKDSVGEKDFHEPKTTISQAKLSPGQLQESDIPAGFFELQQRNNGAGLAKFEALKHSPQVDMGSIKSRDLGNMLSGELVRIGETAAKAQNPGVDFGDLPSKTLTEMGKDVIKSE